MSAVAELTLLKTHKTFEGKTQFWSHASSATQTVMKFSTFIPAGEVTGAILWLSGLTCTDENFITKAGAQGHLAKAGLMILCTDTSPRGLHLPEEHAGYDFGSGASFYVDATTPGYRDHYRMRRYLLDEVLLILEKSFSIDPSRIALSGHSMGGHGALTLGLSEPSKFCSVSALAPIVHPSVSPWGIRALTGYLGEDRETWSTYDATRLVESGHRHPRALFIDQGTDDDYLETQLLTADFENACRAAGQTAEIRYQPGYDHSFYFIATFIESHIAFHAAALTKG